MGLGLRLHRRSEEIYCLRRRPIRAAFDAGDFAPLRVDKQREGQATRLQDGRRDARGIDRHRQMRDIVALKDPATAEPPPRSSDKGKTIKRRAS